MSNTIETEDKLGLRNNNEVLKLLLKNHKTGNIKPSQSCVDLLHS